MRQVTAALREFNPDYDRLGSRERTRLRGSALRARAEPGAPME